MTNNTKQRTTLNQPYVRRQVSKHCATPRRPIDTPALSLHM